MQKRLSTLLFLLLACAISSVANAQIINTVAGTSVAGLSGDTGPANIARLFYPTSVAFDTAGNLFISDAANRRIRKINTSGIITTVVGSGCGFSCYGYGGDGGQATAAELYYPNVIALDTFGNMFIADYGNYRIRKVNAAGIISTYAGNGSSSGASPDGVAATSVNINFTNLALDGAGNIYFGTGYKIRKVDTAGIISSYAGAGTVGFSGDGGQATNAQLNGNGNVVADVAGDLYIVDNTNYRVRKVNTAGIISTVAGNGSPGNTGDGGAATDATMIPFDVSLDKSGNLYITDTANECIRKVDVFGTITTIAGTGVPGFSGDGGPATMARLYKPGGVVLDNFGNIFIADGTNNRIRKISYGNHAPHFVGGQSQTISVCEYSVYDSISSLLSVADTDISQTETWSAIATPLHGTLAGYYVSASTGGIISPAGLYYTPVSGFTGNDTFQIKISDGLQMDTTMIIVTVVAAPGTITGAGSTCAGMSYTLSDAVGPGTWSSSNSGVASIGSASGLVNGAGVGTATITFTPTVGCINTRAITVNAIPTAISGTPGVCMGSTATYSDGIAGGVWSNSSGTGLINATSGIVTGIVAGADTITYTMSPGCAATLAITVYPLPESITGATHLCPGATTTLSDLSTGGAWFSSNPAMGSIGLSTGTVTGISAGTITITYSVTTGVTCITTRSLSIDPSADPIAGTLQSCPGDAVTLTDDGGGTWTSSTPGIASIVTSTGAVSAIATGYTTITYTLPAGCNTTSVFTVNPLPTAITGYGVVCQGSTSSLSDVGGGSWSSNNTGIATIGAYGLLTGISAGSATISYTLTTGCAATLPITVAPLPPAIGGPSSLCAGTTMTLTDSLSGGTWGSSSPSIATINAYTGLLSGIAAGSDVIIYTSAAGCVATALINVNPLPTVFTVTGGGTYCAGGVGFHVGLSGSQHGYNYQLQNSGVPGPTITGASGSAPIDFGLQTVSGIYTIVATSPGSGCSRVMTGSATIIANPLPAAITGPSAVCIGSTITETDAGTGTWASSTPSVAAIGAGTGIVSGLAIGNTTITYTLPTSCFTTSSVSVSTTPADITGGTSVCIGATIIFNDVVTGGTWTSSNPAIASAGSLSGNITGITSGVATITYSLGSGCIKMRTVTVNSLPSGITGTLGICTGHLSPLSDTSTGGSWGSSAPLTASVGIATGIVSGLAIGTATITYTSVLGCATTAVVTVNAAPSGIVGSLHACTGQVSALTNPASGGTWSITPATVALIGTASGIVTGTGAGIATVSYSLGSGCAVAATVTVTASPAAITGPAQVCQGATIFLIDTTTGGTWGSSNSYIASVSGTGIVSGVSSATATISYTMAGCSATRAVTVNALPAIITGVSSLCAGSTTTFTDLSLGGTWTSSAPLIASVGTSSGLVTGSGSGAATITYTLATGCVATKSITINSAPAAIAGGPTLCIGSTVSLTDVTTGGTWLAGPGGAVSVSTSGIVTGLAIGSATISYLVSGCPATTTVTVSSLPPAISGPGQVCSGSTITLTDPGTGTWSSATPGTASVGSATGIVTGGSAGVAIISYSPGPGCTVTATVTVIALPAAISGPYTLCTGATATLTDPASGGVWSSAAIGTVSVDTSGIITGVSGGATIISYLLPATGCAATHSVTSITVPDITLVHNLCAWGDTMTVSNASSPGIYTSSLVTVSTLGGGLGRVTSTAPGTAIITYIVPAGCSATTQFTVNPLPDLIAGPMALCVGDSILLTDATTGGFWSAAGTGVVTIDSATGQVHSVATGTASITFTLLATGCKVDTNITVADVPLAGIITGPDNLCAGTSITLADSIAGGVWSSGGLLTSVTGGVVNGLLAGTDTIKYTVTNICGITPVSKTITINPVPAAGTITGTDSMCVGNAVLLTATDTGGVWSSSNGNAMVSLSGVVNGVTAGMDTIVYTVNNGWCEAATTMTVKVVPEAECLSLAVASKANGANELQIWPNPATNDIVVNSAQAGALSLLNVQGQQLAGYQIKAGNNELKLPAGLSDGAYLLRFAGEDGASNVMKLVITK